MSRARQAMLPPLARAAAAQHACSLQGGKGFLTELKCGASRCCKEVLHDETHKNQLPSTGGWPAKTILMQAVPTL